MPSEKPYTVGRRTALGFVAGVALPRVVSYTATEQPETPSRVAGAPFEAALAEGIEQADTARVRRPWIGARIRGESEQDYAGANYFKPTQELESELNAAFDVVSYYRAVGADTAKSYAAEVVPELARDKTRKLMYALEIWKENDSFVKEFDSKSGIYPDLVRLFQAIIDGGYMERVYLAPFHEGNGADSYPWQMYRDTNANSPEKFKQAFQRIVKLARSMGVKCKFIQWYLTSNGGEGDSQNLAEGYVGDEWVDLVGVSYYNRSKAKGYSETWTPVGAELRRFVSQIEAISARKIWICESGCAASNQGEDKGQWYADLIRLVASPELPRIEAAILFLIDADSTDMRLENAEQKRLVGQAINDAARVTRFDAPSDFNRNLLPPAVSVPASTATWSLAGDGSTFEITTNAPSDMDRGTTSLRVTKPKSTGSSENEFAVYRDARSGELDFELGKPHVFTFKARASFDGFRLSAGMRQPDGDALFAGDRSLLLGTVWQTFIVQFANTFDDQGAWRFPLFRYGNNPQAGWFEVTDLKIARGTYPSPNVDKALRKRARSTPDAGTIRWSCEHGDLYRVTLSGNRTLALPSGLPHDGQELTLRVKQDRAGKRRLKLDSGFRKSSVALTLAEGPNATSLLTFQYDADARKWGLVNMVRWD
ncbi:MAG: glycosyl hydrolase [Actinomycetota bacterium]